MRPLRFLDTIENQSDAAAEQPPADNGRQQFRQLERPDGALSLHDITDATLQHQHREGHRGPYDEPPHKDFYCRQHDLSHLNRPIKRPILNSFRDMNGLNLIRVRQISNGPRDTQNPSVGAG